MGRVVPEGFESKGDPSLEDLVGLLGEPESQDGVRCQI